jgi:Tfp pilus assembly PilM family ATPase
MNTKKRIAAGIAVIAAGMLAAGCGSDIDTADLEDQLKTQLSEDAGVPSEDVTVDCPDGEKAEQGNTFNCTLTAPNGDEVTVDVEITSDDGDFEAVIPPQQFE